MAWQELLKHLAERMVHAQTYIQRISLRFSRLPVVIITVLLNGLNELVRVMSLGILTSQNKQSSTFFLMFV
jgi:hypothetical protein